MKWIVYQANSHCDIAGYKQTFEDRFGSHKKSFHPIKHKSDTELSTKKKKKKIEKSKSALQHQKFHGKLSEYVVLAIQTALSAFYV